MSREPAECLCFRCAADLTTQFLRGRPVPANESLCPSKDGGKTFRVVCSGCGTVNLVKLAGENRGTKAPVDGG